MFDEKTWGQKEFDEAMGHYGMIYDPDDEEPEAEKRKEENEPDCRADKT